MVSLYNNQSIGLDEVPVKAGDIVGVIGAGNVAMDAARTAMRLGAKSVSVYYHRTEADIKANRSEYLELWTRTCSSCGTRASRSSSPTTDC